MFPFLALAYALHMFLSHYFLRIMPGCAKCCLTHICMRHDGWIPSWCHIESEHILRNKTLRKRNSCCSPVDERAIRQGGFGYVTPEPCLPALPCLALPRLASPRLAVPRSAVMGCVGEGKVVYLSFSKRKNGARVLGALGTGLRVYGLKGEQTPPRTLRSSFPFLPRREGRKRKHSGLFVW